MILVGEMRDLETIETALTAAETGHLVLSTLHTLDATETVTRIVSSFPSHQQKSVRIQLAGILKAVISMRLVRAEKGSGRVPAVEVLVSTGLIRDYIINEEKTYMIREAIAHGASQYGMQTFDQSLFTLLQSGRISLEEAIHNATNPDEFKMRVSGIMSTEQAIRAEGNFKRDVTGTGREPIESVIVKLRMNAYVERGHPCPQSVRSTLSFFSADPMLFRASRSCGQGCPRSSYVIPHARTSRRIEHPKQTQLAGARVLNTMHLTLGQIDA